MPLYVYQCEACAEQKEIIRSYKDRDVLVICEHNSLTVDGEVIGKYYPMRRVLTPFAGYSIKGDNSSSVTPKKFRGTPKLNSK